MIVSVLVHICGGMCVILHLVKTDSTEKKPYGQKMCDNFCNVDNCSSQFSFTLLSCNITFDSSCKDSKRYTDNCTFLKRRTNGGNFSKASESKMQRLAGNSTDLLVAPLYRSDSLYVLELEDNILHKYPKVKKLVTAVAYVSKIDKFIFGAKNPNYIYTITLGQKKITILKKRLTTFGLAIDEDSQDVFISDNYHKEVGRMTISNKRYQRIKSTSGFPWSIALDCKRKLIYVATTKSIMLTTYTGKDLGRLDAGKQMLALALNPLKQMLYYNKKDKLFVIKLRTKKSMHLVNLPPGYIPYVFALHDKLYMSSFQDSRLYSYHAQTKRLQQMPKVHSKFSGFNICLVPRRIP